jgi:hypothetical protein
MNFKFYAILAPKTFMRILAIDFMHPIGHQMPWFKVQSLEKTRSSSCFTLCGLHVLCVVLMSVIHPIVGSIILVKAITVVKWNFHLTERFLRGNKVNFIHPTTNFLCNVGVKTFLCILTIDSMHPIGHHVPWFKFQIYEFLFFKKKYSQWILNRA